MFDYYILERNVFLIIKLFQNFQKYDIWALVNYFLYKTLTFSLFISFDSLTFIMLSLFIYLVLIFSFIIIIGIFQFFLIKAKCTFWHIRPCSDALSFQKQGNQGRSEIAKTFIQPQPRRTQEELEYSNASYKQPNNQTDSNKQIVSI